MFLFILEPHSDGGCNDVTSIFTQFNLEKVLHNGASLLGSEGAQFNKEEKLAGECSYRVCTGLKST